MKKCNPLAQTSPLPSGTVSPTSGSDNCDPPNKCGVERQWLPVSVQGQMQINWRWLAAASAFVLQLLRRDMLRWKVLPSTGLSGRHRSEPTAQNTYYLHPPSPCPCPSAENRAPVPSASSVKGFRFAPSERHIKRGALDSAERSGAKPRL